jgi:hypothetical protein
MAHTPKLCPRYHFSLFLSDQIQYFSSLLYTSLHLTQLPNTLPLTLTLTLTPTLYFHTKGQSGDARFPSAGPGGGLSLQPAGVARRTDDPRHPHA